MKALSIVLGILLVLGGFFMMITPGVTFSSMSWVIGFLLLLAGVNWVVDYFTNRKNGTASVWTIVGGILCAILGGLVLINPFIGLLADGLLIYAFDFWLIIGGVLRIFGSVEMKKAGIGSWGWVLAFAIVSVLVGFYALFHIIASALAIGMLVGIVVLMSGINVLMSVSSGGMSGSGEGPGAAA